MAVLFGEAFFRIAGLLVHERRTNEHGRNGPYRIICAGDSTTYGIGASDVNKFSYPRQLQKLLDEKSSHRKFEVINLGIPGMNSSQLLNRFEKNISEIKPDMAVVMVGINDPWNFEESNILKFYNVTAIKKLYLQMELLLNQSKLYQFLKLVYLSGKVNDMKVPEFNNETINKAIEFYQHDPARSEAYNKTIVNNITQLKRISEDNHVNIIFMKYHNIGWGRPELIIHNAYAQFKVPVVDNEIIFRKAAKLGLNVWGNDKWHPNDLGYLLIAENVFNEMIALKIVDSGPIEIFR